MSEIVIVLLLIFGLSATSTNVDEIILTAGEYETVDCLYVPTLATATSKLFWMRSNSVGHEVVAIGTMAFDMGYEAENCPLSGKYSLKIKNVTYNRDNGNFSCHLKDAGNELHYSLFKLTVVSPQGSKCQKGEQGQHGEKGVQGEKGGQGEKGHQGPQGPEGGKGQQGRTGQHGLRGGKGERGQIGKDGIQGIPGQKGMSCSHSLPHVIRSDDYDNKFLGRFVLEEGCDSRSPINYWLSPAGDKGINAKLVIDLAKQTRISAIQIKNTHNCNYNSRGTKGFSVSISSIPTGPWQMILRDTLKDVRNKNCDVDVEHFEVNNTVEARYVQFTVESYYGNGGGLQYLNFIEGIQGSPGSPGEQGPQGVKGEQGLHGVKGEQGPQGVKGDPGIKGPPGNQGLPRVSQLTCKQINQGGNYAYCSTGWVPVSCSCGYACGSWNLLKNGCHCHPGCRPGGIPLDWTAVTCCKIV